MSTLADQTILIIGGTSGIGFGVAKASLLSQAAHVIVASSTPAKVDKAVKRLQQIISASSLPGKVSGRVVDAFRVDVIKKFLADVGKIDHLVWSAGSSTRPVPGEKSAVEFMEAEFWAPIEAGRNVQLNSGGSITFTTASGVLKPVPMFLLQAGAKGAIDTMTRGLAIELAPTRVNAIAPGWVDTEAFGHMDPAQKKQLLDAEAEKLLVKHIADADELADAYIFVMKCKYITGQSINVNGGLNLV